MSDYLSEVFTEQTGALAQTSSTYQRRASQVTLATAISDVIKQNKTLFGEAPTGTGKSVAYLVPGIVEAVRKKKRLLVVTANKAMQEQLIDKDLPLVRDTLAKLNPAIHFTFALLKGRSNYYCLSEAQMFLDTGTLPGLTADDAAQALALTAWGMISDTGEQSSAPLTSAKVWNKFSMAADRCPRKACAFVDKCFAEAAEDAAAAATVVVLNYDLFFHRMKNGLPPTWRDFAAVIFDEGHEAPNVARRCLGAEIGVEKLDKLAADVGHFFQDKKAARSQAATIRTVSKQFLTAVARYVNQRPDEIRLSPGALNGADLVDLLIEVANTPNKPCADCYIGPSDDSDERCPTCEHRARIAGRAVEIANAITEITGTQRDDVVYYLQRPEENPDEPLRANPHNVALRATPYDVGPMLAKILSFFPAKIVVSATMTTGGTFDYIRRQFGNVNQPAGPVASQTPIWTLRVPTPFNFAKQAKFIVPLGIPWPIPENADAFNAAALRAIEQVIHDCQGRTLVLFTSWRRLRYVAENLQTDYPVLVQGDLPARQLAQTFREDTHSVLLATRSFWTGLDVQGESLSCLVIDKLPMESLGDPLLDMLKEKHPDTFWDEFYFPRVAIELAQGAGRLIRSTSDRGAFVLLDSRILAKSYGKMLIRSLPFLGVSKNLADAGKFLSQP